MRYLLLILLFLSTFSFGQSLLVDNMVQLEVEVDSNNEIFHIHILQPSETLYSLGKRFNVAVQDLMLVNNISNDQSIPLSSKIKIPLLSKHILKNKSDSESIIPIIYKVKRKETLFKIAKTYFGQEIGTLMSRNRLSNFSLKVGQPLIVGYWEKEGILNSNNPKVDLIANFDSIATHIIDSTIVLSSHDTIVLDSIDKLEILETELPEIKNQKGIAIWDKTDPNDDFLLVLHKNAKIGSVIKLQHPVTKNIVVANVVDNLPPGIYERDVDILLSKAVAEKLGALNTRFQLNMTYYE